MNSVLRHIPVVREWVRHDVGPTTWEGPEGAKRVLIEEEDAEMRSAMAAALRDAGYQTAACSGPGWHGDGRCPLVEGDGCGAVAGADAVLHVLVASDEPMREVREAIRADHPDLPVTVFAPRPTVERRPDLVEGTTVATGPISRNSVVAAVRDAIGPP